MTMVMVTTAARIVPYPHGDHGLAGFLVLLALGGLIVGALARLLVPGRQPIGILGTIAVGIAGAFAGGFIGRAIWGRGYTPGLLMAVGCSALILWLVFRGRGWGRGWA